MTGRSVDDNGDDEVGGDVVSDDGCGCVRCGDDEWYDGGKNE